MHKRNTATNNDALSLGNEGCEDGLAYLLTKATDESSIELNVPAARALLDGVRTLRARLAEAASELPHCSGPIAERIRVYRAAHSDTIAAQSARIAELEATLREWCDVCAYAETDALKQSIKRCYDKSCTVLASAKETKC